MSPDPSISDTQLVAGGVAAVVLIGVGVYMLYAAVKPPGQGPDTTTTLTDTASLATIATLVPL